MRVRVRVRVRIVRVRVIVRVMFRMLSADRIRVVLRPSTTFGSGTD